MLSKEFYNLKLNIMKKPSKKKVRNYFRNAEKIESLGGSVFSVDIKDFLIEESIFTADGKYELWNHEKGYAKIITYKKPKENILTLSEPIGDYVIFNGKKYVPEVVAFEPEKKELAIGKWYVYPAKPKFITFVKEDGRRYGIGTKGEWFNDSAVVKDTKGYREATHQEVESALKSEAVRRGYKDGVFMEGLYFGTKEAYKCNGNDFDYEEIPLQVLKGKMGLRDKVGNVIFCDGVWAEIIQPKKITQTEIETELGYNIEIV